MGIPLPEPFATYFNEETPLDEQKAARCFGPHATVVDEVKTYRGLAAIVSWKAGAKARYLYTVEPLHLSQKGQNARVIARVTGNFPGSPVELTHAFVLSDGRIASLEITL